MAGGIWRVAWAAVLLPAAAANAGTVRSVRVENLRDAARPPGPGSDAALQRRLAGFAGCEDSVALREEVADAVLLYYQESGWPVVEVEVSGTEDGHLVAGVREGMFGSVRVEGGHRWMRQVAARDWERLQGKPLRMADVTSRLEWHHRNPLHAATIGFEPAAEPAVADAVVTVHSPRPLRVFAGWRNDGIEPLGRHRFSAGFEVADVWGMPFWLGAEALTGEDGDGYEGARAEWRGYLPWRHELRLTGQRVSAEADGVVPGFTSSTSVVVRNAAVRYLVPVRAGAWRADAGIGAGFLQTTSEVSVADLRAGARAEAVLLTAEVSGERITAEGAAGFHADVAFSPGGWTGHSRDAAHAALRTGAEAEFVLVRGQAWMRREAAAGWTVDLQADGQWASAPVLPVIQHSPAGGSGVRGFPEASVLGDSGVRGSMEVQAPAVSVSAGSHAAALRPVVFVDGGWTRDDVTGRDEGIAGAGVGVRFRWGTHASLVADYGWRLTEPGGRAHLALRLEF